MAQRKSASRSRSKSAQTKPGAGCLIWLVLLLVTLLLFVINWERIQETLKTTRFVEALGDRSASERTEDPPAVPEEPPASPRAAEPDAGPASQGDAEASREPVEPVPDQAAPAAPPSAPAVVAPPPAVATHPAPAAGPVEQVNATRIVSLFFVRVDADGMVTRHEVKRTVGSSDSPLTDALNALLEGPTTDELSRDLISLVPSGTKLLSAQVRGSTAYLNFNDAFMINPYAIEGYAAQLKQIVYTATSFGTVKDVQFLIEGEKRDYLGGEGVYIGKPLSRGSF